MTPEQRARAEAEANPSPLYEDGRPKMHRHAASFDVHRDDECSRGVLDDGTWTTSRRRVYVFDAEDLDAHERFLSRRVWAETMEGRCLPVGRDRDAAPLSGGPVTLPTVVGLDLSLTATGVCRAAGGVVEVRRITSRADDGTLAARSIRLRSLAGIIARTATDAVLVVVEAPAYASSTGKVHDRAGLWWLVVARLTGAGVPVVEVTPQAVKTYATGKGNADKDDVLSAVVRRYPGVAVTKNDEADALVLAAMGRRALGHPLDVLPAAHLRAMTKAAWPQPEGLA